MPNPSVTAARYVSLRSSARALVRTAPLLRWGIFSLGVTVFLDRVSPLLSDAQLTWGERRVLGIVALITLGGFGLGGWIASRLVRALAEVIELLIDSAEAEWRTADLLELQVVPALGRIAHALERSASTPEEVLGKGLQEIRRLIASGRWDRADRLVATLARDFPQSPEAAGAGREVDEARQAVIARLRTQLEQARRSHDAGAVINLRNTLTLHLKGDALHDLDRKVARWLVDQIKLRMRDGSPLGEVMALATRVHETFADTPEGAALEEMVLNLKKSRGG